VREMATPPRPHPHPQPSLSASPGLQPPPLASGSLLSLAPGHCLALAVNGRRHPFNKEFFWNI